MNLGNGPASPPKLGVACWSPVVRWLNRCHQAVQHLKWPAFSRPARLAGLGFWIKIPIHLLHSCFPVSRKGAGSVLSRGVCEWRMEK
eukprot:5819378-Amphidinium_carterae.1